MALNPLPLEAMRQILPVVLLLALCACGNNDIAAKDFAHAYAQALCQRAQTCGAAAAYVEADCEAQTQALFADDVTKGISAGKITYSGEQAHKCVEAIRNTSCLSDSLSTETLALCFGAAQGKTAAGQPCQGIFECAAGVCLGAPGGACPNTCPQVLGDGEACSLISGPACDVRKGLACSGGKCVKPGAAGAGCGDNLGCAEGNVCVSGKCAPLRKSGEGCAEDSSCVAGYFCGGGSDEGGGHCEARLAEGAACATDEDDVGPAMRGAQCQDGLVCRQAGLKTDGTHVSGHCTKAAAQGAACITEPDGFQDYVTGCQQGLVCISGSCQLPPTSGSCGAHYACKSDTAYCASDDTCQPLREDGAACDNDPQCHSGTCYGGKCGNAELYCHA